ncbi:hypothetical protein YC2023_040120 [Brassica napus]
MRRGKKKGVSKARKKVVQEDTEVEFICTLHGEGVDQDEVVQEHAGAEGVQEQQNHEQRNDEQQQTEEPEDEVELSTNGLKVPSPGSTGSSLKKNGKSRATTSTTPTTKSSSMPQLEGMKNSGPAFKQGY